jgi:F420-0:gamma-glutamyl ligase
MSSVRVEALKTRVFRRDEDLLGFIIASVEACSAPLEGRILAITSKIVSIAESRLVPRSEASKKELVHREADRIVGELRYESILTVKHQHLIVSAGIDESNSENGDYILYPRDPFESACRIHAGLKKHFALDRLGVLLTDSRTHPLRRGVVGISLAHFGFRGVDNKMGSSDLFGTPLKMTQVNVADAVAASAVFCMGESNESKPLALVDAPVSFEERPLEDHRAECSLPWDEDMYSPVFSSGSPSFSEK